MEVVGLPADAATRKGIVLGYRIIGTIRVVPDRAADRARRGRAEGEQGHRRHLDPQHRQHGRAGDRQRDAASAAGSRTRSVEALRILPGKSVNIPLGTKLPSGRYTATLRLVQRGRVALRGTKKFTVK